LGYCVTDRSGDIVAANHTGFVQERQADPGDCPDVRAVLLDSGEPLTVVFLRCTNMTRLRDTQNTVSSSTWSLTKTGKPATMMPSSTNWSSDWL
jgi:hypothetical protein